MKKFANRDEAYLPESFYNIKADLRELPKPPLHPGTGQPLSPSDLEAIFPPSFIAQETSQERYVPIPLPVLDVFRTFRPTPLICATGLKQALDTPAHIFYKFEGAGPTGSHKSNTALVQAYLAQHDGVGTLTTETGAGQWGSALASAGARFGVQVRVFMVRISHRQKPGRRILMELFDADVLESPSPNTESGKRFFKENHDHPGSLGIAISEAVEYALKNGDVKYSLGSVLDSVLMHQTVIGQEARQQMREYDLTPDVIVGCVGGGSNFAGLSFPFLGEMFRSGGRTRFVAVEPDLCPTLTRGKLDYDHGDTAGLTPLLYMHTLGMDFIPPPIHAGGLRYHGMAPLVSELVRTGLVEAASHDQDEVFQAGKLFLKSEGILPAPESCHAIATVIREAKKAREKRNETVILFNLSGHGFLDINAYQAGGKNIDH